MGEGAESQRRTVFMLQKARQNDFNKTRRGGDGCRGNEGFNVGWSWGKCKGEKENPVWCTGRSRGKREVWKGKNTLVNYRSKEMREKRC